MRWKLLILSLLLSTTSLAQAEFKGHYEAFVQLEYDLSEKFSQEFTIESRFNWYDDHRWKLKIKQIDLAHFTSYKINQKHDVALGIQYRFEENFEKDEHNELRLTEQYKYEMDLTSVKMQHRIRAEQRFSAETSHRYRYKIEITRNLNDAISISGALETLLTVSKNSKPEYEQRIAAEINLRINDFTELELGTEYRLDDFTANLGHEFFLVSGVKFKL